MDAGPPEFRDIYEQFYPKILRYMARMVDESEAEDLTQEVFGRVAGSLAAFRGESQLSTWIYRIATNAALDRLGSPSYQRTEQGRCVDMSAGGLRMELQDPILVGTPVSFHLLQTKRAGTAFVRHCTPTGSGYVIGVEFIESR